ncbi:MAG TPA: protein kinase, partial [Labilithrix sp.]|nr:protein kinase [Labilithrix sp.]
MRTCPQCQNPYEDAHKFCPSCGFPVSKVAQQTDDPLIGRTLPGGYVILDLVGIGGMGRVYRAEQTNLGRTVAVKIIHPHLVGEENAAARFITEARAASRLNHPNSVAVIDFGKTEDGQLYLVMEFLRGKDLARVQYEEGPLSFRRIVSILRQVLAALSEAHHLEIIHRDLKPENIILEPVRTGGDFVKVVDFGLAKMREGAGPNITSPGIVCGTPEYMSPEQGRGDPLDPRSDLYAVGVIFYQLLTGRLPFEAESPTQVVLMHITEPPPDPRAAAPERVIPSLLADVCLMALAKEPQHRFGNADEFGEALADALTQIESTVPKAGPTASTLKCPKCGANNVSTQKFCGECGT